MSPVLTSPAAAHPTADGRTPVRPASKVLYMAAGVVAVAGLGAGLALPPGEAVHAVTGSVQLWQNASAGEYGTACTGHGGNADITAGAPVRIRDASGKLIATTKLGQGVSDGAACVFPFSAGHVPQANGYRVAVGDENRPSVAYTFRDMRNDDWDVRVVLGA